MRSVERPENVKRNKIKAPSKKKNLPDRVTLKWKKGETGVSIRPGVAQNLSRAIKKCKVKKQI